MAGWIVAAIRPSSSAVAVAAGLTTVTVTAYTPLITMLTAIGSSSAALAGYDSTLSIRATAVGLRP